MKGGGALSTVRYLIFGLADNVPSHTDLSSVGSGGCVGSGGTLWETDIMGLDDRSLRRLGGRMRPPHVVAGYL